MISGVKRKMAIAFLAAVVALAVGGVLALRTRWAGDELCAVAAARIRQTTGLELSVGGCRFEPLALAVGAFDVRLGPERAPVFTADSVRATLAPLHAPGRQFELRELRVVHPRVKVALPGSRTGSAPFACPPPVLRRFGVHRLSVERASVDVTFAGGEQVVLDRVDVEASSLGRLGVGPVSLAGDRRARVEVSVGGGHVGLPGREVRVGDAHLAAEVALDLSWAKVQHATVELPGVTLAATGSIDRLCQPRVDLAASLQGDAAALLALVGAGAAGAEGHVAADLAIRGAAAAPEIQGEVRLEQVGIGGYRPGDATAQVRFAGTELHVDRLDLPTQGGHVAARGTVRFGHPVTLEAEASLRAVELGEVFGRLGLPGAWVMARMDGTARVSGTASPLRLAGEAGVDVIGFRVLDHAWERYRPGEATYLDLARARVDGSVRVDRAGVEIQTARVRAGAGSLTARAMLHFDSRRGFDVACAGAIDLGALRHVGPVPIAGLARLDGGLIRAAPYGNPHIEGRVGVHELRFLQLDLGDLAGDLAYDDYVLHLAGGSGRRGVTRYQVDATVALDRGPLVTEARYAANGRLHDLFEAAMPWLPAAVHARDAIDADVQLAGTARGPVTALRARFEGGLGRGELLGRGFDGGRISGRIEDGSRAVVETAELRQGGGVARASGVVGFEAPFPWDLKVSFDGVPLRALKLPGADWAGAVAGTATLGGSYEAPLLKFSARGAGVSVSRVPVGAIALGGRLEGALLSMTAEGDGVKFRGSARTTGDAPFEAVADLDVADVMRFVPGGPPAGLHARVRGRAAASGVLADVGRTRAEVHLDEIRGGYGEFRVDNAGPAVLALEDGRATVRSLAFRGANTQFALTGAREASGALKLDARGALDLRLLGGLLPGVTDPRGQLVLEAHVGGTLGEPSLVGSGTLREAGFRMRDLPVVFTGMAGQVAFSQNRMLFDRLSASVNGGNAQLDGELELVRFFPARVRVGAQLEEVPLRVPEWLPSVVSGRLEAAGTWDAMRLSGKLHVVRARYAERVDLEKRLLEVRRRKAETKPFDKAGEWVSLDVALAVDGDARIENDLARGGLRGDLTLTGTLASVGLVGTLTMTPGSRGTFRGNDFIMRHAVVDFTDRRKIRMTLDAVGDAQVRDYQVFMHLFGPYEDPTIQLTSQPALSQQDIVTLLSLGYTSRDAAAASGVSGVATAAAAQALFSASGLDEQVKRFAPRGGLLRDFTVRITSAYSESAGQVLPRAQFESTVLDDRLRLRYQAPLASARGQSAQAEMRLSPHTSVQYQWDNDSTDVTSGGDHGVDLKLRWDWTE